MKLTTKQKYIVGALLVGAIIALALVTLSGGKDEAVEPEVQPVLSTFWNQEPIEFYQVIECGGAPFPPCKGIDIAPACSGLCDTFCGTGTLGTCECADDYRNIRNSGGFCEPYDCQPSFWLWPGICPGG